MKALVKSKAEVGLWMQEVPVPVPMDDDVLIEVLRTGICGTDLHIYRWDPWAQRHVAVPTVIGHEFVGTICQVGARVKDYKVGDIVSGEGHVVCGRCRNCMAGRRHLCKSTQGVGVNRAGAFAEYIVLPQGNVWLHAAGIDRDLQAIFDPFGNAVHTALAFDLLGEDVLITGAGPIGLMATAIARHAGARHVVVSDPNPKRLKLAETMGASLAVNGRDVTIPMAMAQLGMKEGFDVGLEMSGHAAAIGDMVDHMFHGGCIAALGLPSDAVTIDWSKMVANMLTIKGIYGRQMFETWYKMTVMLQSGLDISPVITHRFSCDDFEDGFEAMKQGDAGKVVLTWKAG